LKVVDSVVDESCGEAFFTRFGWASGEPSSPFTLFLVSDDTEGDAPFVLATKAVDFLAERRKDICPPNQRDDQKIESRIQLLVLDPSRGRWDQLCATDPAVDLSHSRCEVSPG
jgi:hypothetical protein